MNYQKIRTDFINILDDDYVPLFALWSIASRHYSGGDQLKRAEVLSLIRDFLVSNMMVAGDLAENGGFIRWEGTSDEVVERIDSEWKSLKKPLNIGDVCWFNKVD